MKLSVPAHELEKEVGGEKMTVAHELLENIEINIPAHHDVFIALVEKLNNVNQQGN